MKQTNTFNRNNVGKTYKHFLLQFLQPYHFEFNKNLEESLAL